MILLIDERASQQLVRCAQVPVHGKMRYYYHTGPDCLFHLVCRAGIVEHLVGATVNAAVGWGEGWHNKCHPDHEGLQLTKVTIYERADGKPTTTLSNIISQSSKGNKARRPYRGATWTKRWGGDN